ncbi:AMIN-like domain-containing (lipo)protein [Yinghuangia seranimata]|uniref:AMIN-like domain-containing (lipo)protein n=1 Tax=Yinghuangia seranimata TaxID=408067 RepID=UPI00248B8BA4|nr:hypothetical protein [Yinghuangia seranimata]MDI2132139.1 hypothetical protein [Yinghuangia seranimata]
MSENPSPSAVPTPTALPRRRAARAALATGAAGALLAVALLPVATADAAAPAAAQRSVALSAPAMAGPTYLTNIRTGAHPTFDRVVLDFSGGVPAFGVTGGPGPLTNCGSGQEVPLPGDQFHEVQAASAAHDADGNPTYTGPRVVRTPQLARVTGYAVTCDFEGHLDVGVMTQGHVSEVRTFVLTDPSRIVVDVYR